MLFRFVSKDDPAFIFKEIHQLGLPFMSSEKENSCNNSKSNQKNGSRNTTTYSAYQRPCLTIWILMMHYWYKVKIILIHVFCYDHTQPTIIVDRKPISLMSDLTKWKIWCRPANGVISVEMNALPHKAYISSVKYALRGLSTHSMFYNTACTWNQLNI